MESYCWKRQKFLTLSIIALFLPSFTAFAMRRKQSDSILEIMNTREIEQILAERRLNATRDRENPLIIQNDLDDEYGDISGNEQFDRRRSQQGRQEYGTNFGAYQNDRRRSERVSKFPGDYYRDFNESSNNGENFGPDLLVDLQDFRTDKLLKSSKKALYVTKKEYLKKDWCKTEPLIQRIREQGCLTRTIVNRFCYGQCNSFYIPKSPKRRRNNSQHGNSRTPPQNRHHFEDEDLTGAAFRSCGFCKPKKFTWMTITLRCPSMVPQLRKKRIQRIRQCRCMAQPLD